MSFKLGYSGNPLGRPALPPEIRLERRKNQANLIKLIAQYFSMTHEEAQKRLDSPKTLQLEEAIQGMIGKAKEGDTNAFKYLIELLVGKIPEAEEGFTDEDARIVTRVKEVLEEQKATIDVSPRKSD